MTYKRLIVTEDKTEGGMTVHKSGSLTIYSLVTGGMANCKKKYKVCGRYWFSEQYVFEGVVADYEQTEDDIEITASVSLTLDRSTMKRVTNDSMLAKILRKIYNGHF